MDHGLNTGGVMIDWAAVGTAVMGVGSFFGGIWLWIQKQRRDMAETRAGVAESEAAAARAESNEAVFTLVTRRLQELQSEVDGMRTEMSELRLQVMTRDRKIHSLEMYIRDLQHTLHAHGIDSPPMRET